MFDVIAPIFLVIGIAAYIGRQFNPDPRGLSTFLIYVFIPALAFRGLAQSELNGDELIGLAGVALAIMGIMAGIGLGFVSMLGLEQQRGSAFMLSVILINAANYGIPLNEFAFGEAGGQRAIIYYVVNTSIGNILGIYFASRGTASARAAMLNVLKIPISHAALLGLIFNLMAWELPTSVSRSVDLLADAAIPCMLALLGLQLARTSIQAVAWRPIVLATATRLILAPLIAVPLALLFGLTGVTFQVAVVQSSMPTAVLANALATQFDSDAEFTSTVTLVSTLASVVTLSILLAILMD